MKRATRVFAGRRRITRLSRNKWAKCSKSNKALLAGQKVSGEHFSSSYPSYSHTRFHSVLRSELHFLSTLVYHPPHLSNSSKSSQNVFCNNWCMHLMIIRLYTSSPGCLYDNFECKKKSQMRFIHVFLFIISSIYVYFVHRHQWD